METIVRGFWQLPKVWTISFIKERESSRLMIRHLQMLLQKSDVTPIASVEKNLIEKEAIHQVADKKKTQ